MRDEQIRSLEHRVEQMMIFIQQNTKTAHDAATAPQSPTAVVLPAPATTTTIAHTPATPSQMHAFATPPALAAAPTLAQPVPSTLALEHIRQSVAKVWAAIPQSRVSWDSSFIVWMDAVTGHLVMAGLESVLDDSMTAHHVMDLHACRIIRHLLPDNVRLQYMQHTDPRLLWATLNSTYNRITETTQADVRVRFEDSKREKEQKRSLRD